jgi:hypothetical protein
MKALVNSKKRTGKRGALTPRLDIARAIVRAKLEAGEPVNREKLQKEYGMSNAIFDTAIYAEVARREALEQLGLATWHTTAQEKLDAGMRQYKKNLDMQFEQRVQQEIRLRIESTVLPSLRKREDDANRVIKARKGVMSKATYTKILSCLHPDRVDGDVLKRRFEQVFHLFKDMELLLVAEAGKPLTGMEVPDSLEGLMALRRGRKKGAVRVK